MSHLLRDARIAAAYRSGQTSIQIGVGHGISRWRVRQILDRDGVARATLVCHQCGGPIRDAQRTTMRYCSKLCRHGAHYAAMLKARTVIAAEPTP
jgi:hypothetical protein